jgi:hypothetical protein
VRLLVAVAALILAACTTPTEPTLPCTGFTGTGCQP